MELPIDEDTEDVSVPSNVTGNPNPDVTESNDVQPTIIIQDAPAGVPSTARRYPTRSRNPVLRYNPNWA